VKPGAYDFRQEKGLLWMPLQSVTMQAPKAESHTASVDDTGPKQTFPLCEDQGLPPARPSPKPASSCAAIVADFEGQGFSIPSNERKVSAHIASLPECRG